MCGFVLLKGPRASERIGTCLEAIGHRGPDDSAVWSNSHLSIGFRRLAINDETSGGRQPYIYDDYIAAINGEIYNYANLKSRHHLNIKSQCDTHIILSMFVHARENLLNELEGFYSGVILKKTSNEIFLLRDHIGKKPLFIGKSGEELFISSELKSFDSIEWFENVPCGISQLNVDIWKISIIEAFSKKSVPKTCLYETLENAISKRIPSGNRKLGVFLSGGLDSSIIAAFVSKQRKDAIYFSLGSESSPDIQMVLLLAEKLNLSNIRRIDLPTDDELPELIRNVVYFTESYNPSIISNGLATYLLSKAAHKEGLKVILSGEGADEFFGGYHYNLDFEQWKNIREELIHDMNFTELRRLDLCSMAHSIEARCPFLDQTIRNISDNIDQSDIYKSGLNKTLLRDVFGHMLPSEIALRKKTSFDVGSGIRRIVVEYLTRNGRSESDELFDIWKTLFPNWSRSAYFYQYPVFDTVIAQRGVTHK